MKTGIGQLHDPINGVNYRPDKWGKYNMKHWIAIISLLILTAHAPEIAVAEKDLLAQGNGFAVQGQYEEAVRYYKQALEESKSAAAYNLAVIYHHEMNFKAKAISYYLRFLELAPDDPEAAQVRRWLRQCQSEVDPQNFPPESNPTEMVTAAKLIQADGASPYVRQANQYLAEGQYEKAILAYRQGIVLDRSPIACYNLAVIYDYDLHYLEQAIHYYQRYLGFTPDGNPAARARTRVEELQRKISVIKTATGAVKAYKLRG